MKKFRFRITKAAQARLLALLVIPYFLSCGKDSQPKSSDKEMTNVRITAGAVEFVPQKQSDGKTWKFMVPLGVDQQVLTSATITFTLSEKATPSLASGSTVNLTSPVNITVTAEDGSSITYTIAKEDGTSDLANITEFYITVAGEKIDCDIDANNRKITIPFLPDVDMSNITPTFTLSLGATSVPASGVAQNLTAPVDYVVTAHNNTTKLTWTVVRVTSDQAKILSFSLELDEEQVIEGEIDDVNSTVTLSVEYIQKALLVNAVPIFTYSDGANVTPDPGEPQDFSKPVTYTITAYDGTTIREWTVVVEIGEQPEVKIVGRTGDTEDKWVWSLYQSVNSTTTYSAARRRGEVTRLSGTYTFDKIHDGTKYTGSSSLYCSFVPHVLTHFTTDANSSTSTTTGPHLYPQYFTIDMGRKASYTRLIYWSRERSGTGLGPYSAWVWSEFEVWGTNEVKPVTGVASDDLKYWTSWVEVNGTDQWKEGWEKLATCVIELPSGNPIRSGTAEATEVVTDVRDIALITNGFEFKIDANMQSKPFQYLRFVLKKNPSPTYIQWSELEFYGKYAE